MNTDFIYGIATGLWLSAIMVCIMNRINPLHLLLNRLTALVRFLNRGLQKLYGKKKCEICDENYTFDKFCTQNTWEGICLECRDKYESARRAQEWKKKIGNTNKEKKK